MTLNDFLRLVRAGAAMVESPSVGNGISLFVAAAEAALTFIPHEELRGHLDDAARRRADMIGDMARIAKFGE